MNLIFKSQNDKKRDHENHRDAFAKVNTGLSAMPFFHMNNTVQFATTDVYGPKYFLKQYSDS